MFFFFFFLKITPVLSSASRIGVEHSRATCYIVAATVKRERGFGTCRGSPEPEAKRDEEAERQREFSVLRLFISRFLQTKHHGADALEYFEGSGMEPPEENDRHPADADAEGAKHEVRHHRDLRQLVFSLQKTVQGLSHDQSKLAKDVSRMRRNSTELSVAVTSLQGASGALFSARIDGQLRQLEERVLAQGERMRNASSCFQSVGKLHASTVELFRDLRALEKKVDRGLTDLRKEVSKCDFDVATALSLSKAVRQDEIARRESLASLKNDLVQAKAELDKSRYKVLTLEGLVLNTTVSRRKAGSDWVSQEVKIANLEVGSTRLSKMVDRNSRKLAHLARSLDRAVNREVLDEWKRRQEDLASIVRNITEEVPTLRNNITRLEGEVGKFEDTLPQGKYL
ncbi:hypothetical protein HPB48_015526 [Haemaphysalis longicornis]|uniref:Paramyosin n=1 Tax=Haemaphysalis longicornis TaxID=44386 RepID=A0A9J6FJG4_HAELO|nr:hypothetical protein HPB48_015526 [Haemaphysalis longicornis]